MPTKTIHPYPLALQITCIIFGITGLTAYAFSKFLNITVVSYLTVAGFLGFTITFIFLLVMLRRFTRILAGIALSLGTVILGTYTILFVTIVYFQDTIANRQNAFFQPKTMTAEEAAAVAGEDVQKLELKTPDGVTLRGWLVREPVQTPSPLLIYFDGSGSEVSGMLPYARKLSGYAVALVNYRGFGLSEGTPSQAYSFADALLIYDTLIDRPDIDPGRVAVMGYSQGTGIAVYLAEQRKLTGVILAAPYDRLTLVGLKEPPIFSPLSGMMKHYFDSISRAPSIHTPLLCLVGDKDRNITNDLSLKLAAAWGGSVQVITYTGGDHGFLFQPNSAWTDITIFLEQIAE